MGEQDAQLALLTGNYGLGSVNTYNDYERNLWSLDISMQLSVMGTFIALLLLSPSWEPSSPCCC